ncbi:RHD3/Sey1 [Umbelopsis sp. AD052]|nr:RHD3/Sey1 [Umbelopsis sp. AD052]
MTDTNQLSFSQSDQPESQGVKTLVGENTTNSQQVTTSNGSVPNEQSGSIAPAALTSDHHPSNAWEQDTTTSPRLQIVDEKQDFTNDLPEYMEKWGLAHAGFDYNCVAVFGSQSTGKSTLLNRLFGTTFDVMDETQRRQTTKGIWMSRGRGMRVLVMDVEGTDGRERGEDQDFERKSALFSMATSEVIILNLWEHQVGLYQGANMGLLKTVFEVNLQLFQSQRGKEKTLLFFVIRDHVGSTPLANLSNTLQADLEKIWAGLSKPEGLENCKIQDYFDFMYTGLPHKVLLPEKFETEVDNLRSRFTNPTDPNYVFHSNYHKRIPADGFHVYASGIWEQIMSNKDLDLPTQQELLAQYRCDEIASAASVVFLEAISALKAPVLEKGQIVSDLGSQMAAAREQALKSFDKDASRYHAGVYEKKRLEMLTKLNAQLSVYFVGQLRNLHKQAVLKFQDHVKNELKKPSYNFATVVENATATSEKYFKENAQEIVLQDTDWSYESEFAQLKEDFSELSGKARADEIRKMTKALEKQVENELTEPVSMALNNPSADMWHKILSTYRTAKENGQDTLIKKAKSFNSSDDELEESVNNLVLQSWLLLRRKIDEELADSMLLLKLRSKFEEKFRYDDQGLPKVWKPEDDIDAYFKKARDDTLALIPLFAKIDTSQDDDLAVESTEDFDYQRSLTVLGESKQLDITNRFKRESDAFYLEAKRSIVATTAKIPMWLVALLIVLGWNEFMAIITSPIYLIMFVFLITAGYIVYALNLWGPLERVLSAIAGEATKIVREKVEHGVERARDQGIELNAMKSFAGSSSHDSNQRDKAD